MSLHALPNETIATMPTDQLENVATNLIIASFQACGWEPSKRQHGHQYLQHTATGREVAIEVVGMEP